MAIKSRADLKVSFTQGRRPKQQEFWDWQESYYHKTEDPITIAGWQFKSFLKELRAEGTAITSGGFSILDIPFGVTKLKAVRVMGRATTGGPQFSITTSLTYFSDKLVASLNGVPATGNPMPATFFAHFLLGTGSVPPATFKITTPGPAFDGTFDFSTIPKDIPLDFTSARFLMLTIKITTGSFVAGSDNLYYGLQYE
jgi:hypothetical protein